MVKNATYEAEKRLMLVEFERWAEHIRTKAEKYNIDLSKITLIKVEGNKND
jgi:hypothetical protein